MSSNGAARILVTGATGNVGSELIPALLGAGAHVRALVRNGNGGLADGVEVVKGNLDQPATLEDALQGVEALFLMSGYRGLPELLARVAGAGIDRVVLLSGGAAVASDTNNPISRYMLDSERTLQESNLGWTILRPYEFMSNTLRWAGQLREGDTLTLPFATVPNATVDPYDIAAVAARALLSSGHDGATYRLSGPEPLFPVERVRILGEVLERPLRMSAEPEEGTRAQMLESMPEEYVDAFFQFNGGGLDESKVLDTVGEVTGAPPRSFKQWAQAHAEAFR
jgi:uncharacterized protein YbjT (DUF2867 family)